MFVIVKLVTFIFTVFVSSTKQLEFPLQAIQFRLLSWDSWRMKNGGEKAEFRVILYIVSDD